MTPYTAQQWKMLREQNKEDNPYEELRFREQAWEIVQTLDAIALSYEDWKLELAIAAQPNVELENWLGTTGMKDDEHLLRGVWLSCRREALLGLGFTEGFKIPLGGLLYIEE